MNEKQFLNQLDKAMKYLAPEERQDLLHDYEEHFAIGKEEGKSEEEIAEALGTPEKLGKEILATYHLNQAESKATSGNMMRAVWAGIGLGFFNLIIVLGPFIALASVVVAGWVTSGALVLAPLLLPVNSIIYPGTFEWSDLYFMMVSCGIGLLLVIGMYYATKGFNWLFVRYLKFNISLVKGGLKS